VKRKRPCKGWRDAQLLLDVHQQFPITTLSPAKPGRIYLDCTRNTRGQALAAAYCVRPFPGATVSAPLKWSEVRRGLDPGKFTIRTIGRAWTGGRSVGAGAWEGHRPGETSGGF